MSRKRNPSRRQRPSGGSATRNLQRTINGPMYALSYIPNDDPPPIQQDWKITRRIRWRPPLDATGQFRLTEANIAAQFPATNIINFSWVKIELRGSTNSDISLTSALDGVTAIDSGVVGSRRARVGLRASLLNKAVHLVNGTNVLFNGRVNASASELGQYLVDMVITVLTANPSLATDNSQDDYDLLPSPAPTVSSSQSLVSNFRRRMP